jgi:hypothetical protein
MTKAWLDDDEVTTTFRSLRQAQVQAAEDERARIVALLQSMDVEQGMATHNEKPSSVCRICRAITNIQGGAS